MVTTACEESNGTLMKYPDRRAQPVLYELFLEIRGLTDEQRKTVLEKARTLKSQRSRMTISA